MTSQPRVVDNDNKNEIMAVLDGRAIRWWTYADDDERRRKIWGAREFVEGWCAGQKELEA